MADNWHDRTSPQGLKRGDRVRVNLPNSQWHRLEGTVTGVLQGAVEIEYTKVVRELFGDANLERCDD